MLSSSYVQVLQQELCSLLLEEALVDLAPKFSALCTQSWMSDPEPVTTICLTLTDYFEDYQHLHTKYGLSVELGNFELLTTISSYLSIFSGAR